MRKLIIIPSLIVIIFIAGAILIYNTHPIALKWATGTARVLGKPIPASVYTNDKQDSSILVYKNGDDGYVLGLKKFDKQGMLRYIQIYPKYNWVGRPAGTSTYDYDIIAGRLFQSEVGQKTSSFKDDMKGFGMDPHLSVAGKNISFNVPYQYLGYNTIKVILN
ncbi:hypothetical protein [Mucilaginibacter pedocola]|uniref:Uncharacterized protein n=1 Tax=Mucilaginibacter pedocola TaxID=1792845 RepID=A0A1S9PD93_9SPHI|nr:hypothetical protein [Mucilaginibacter pedocola]OOQ58827.1 hypothetical protein BC343_09280 [Mucilaginibacter pedocola]